MNLTIEDLDAEVTEESPEPFVIDLGDEKITLPSARDIPSSLLVDLGSVSEMELASRVLDSDEWKRILNHRSMNLSRLQVLSQKYYEYLQSSGLGELGKAPALPRSSTGTAPR